MESSASDVGAGDAPAAPTTTAEPTQASPAEPTPAAASAPTEPTQASAAAAPIPAAAAASAPCETIVVRAVFGGATHEISVGLDKPVSELVNAIAAKTKCAAATMKIMLKGLLCAPNRPELLTRTLREAGVTNNAKLLVVGATASQLMEVISAQAAAKSGTLSADPEPEDDADDGIRDWSDMPVHKRVVGKGKPADAQFAYRPGQEPCPPSIYGMADSHGKVRFTLKLEEGMLIINTNENTKRVPLASIRQVLHKPIRGHEEYLIVGLMLGTTMQSVYYVYWFPAQNIESFKLMII